MIIDLCHKYDDIISLDNLLCAWQEFIKGKRNRKDVCEFSVSLMDNILSLHTDLKTKKYTHGGYSAFNISDPKPRNIHKASVRDRLLHHAIHRTLYPYFDNIFIFDSYSCRKGKGTHKALDRFTYFSRKASKNNTRTCHVLKCDIRKFFASINHDILISILKRHINDCDIVWLLEKIIRSFSSDIGGKGLPLGNLTSQLFVNIYMNEFDQFVKHICKEKYYIRYTDDFVFMHTDKKHLFDLIPKLYDFLHKELLLSMHPNKVFIKTLVSGVDFLGWIHFSDHRVLRTATKRRMMKRLRSNPSSETVQSYIGLLKHGNTRKLNSLIMEILIQ